MPNFELQKACKTRINRHRKFYMWHKVGSDMKLCDVEVASDIYKRQIGVGNADYVDVFGYGVPKRGVNVSKLLERV